MRYILEFIADMLLAGGCVYALMMAYDALTYPLIDLCNAIAPLIGR